MFDPNKRYDMSPSFRAFLRDWLAWTERGAPEGEPYNRSVGLCASAWRYDPSGCLTGEIRDFLPSLYPFGENEYDKAYYTCTQHLDPNRLAFVRANAE